MIDYIDPDFDNESRNRGMDAEFYSHSAPFTPGFSSINGKLYNGLFLNESGPPFWNPPYYSVQAPETISFGSPLGTRPVYLSGWEGDDADFEQPGAEETGVVFTDAGAEARASLKISRVSNNSNAFKASQRKVAHTSDDWQHLVYESMGHVWYEAKSSSGSWELMDSDVGVSQRLHVDVNGGESPSIDHSVMDSFGYETTMIAYQDGSYIRMHPFGNYAGMPDDFYDGDPISFSHGGSSSFDVKPVVMLTEKHDVLIFWRSSQGIKYRVYEFSSTTNSFKDNQPEDSGTITGTSGIIDFAVSKVEYYNSYYFDIAFSVANGSGEAIKYSRLLYSTSSETVNQYYGTPTTISSSSYVRNKLPSITTPNLYSVKVGWVSSTSSSWSPYLTKATVAELHYTSGLSVSRTVLSQYVRAVSVNKLADNSEWYAAWNSIVYTDPSYPPEYFHSNYVAKGSALGTIKKINTRGWDVQLPGAPSENDMQVFAYYPQQAPRYWEQSNSLGSYLKARPLKSSFGRGIALSDSTTGVLFSVHDLTVDGRPVAFVPIRPNDSEAKEEDLSVEERLSLKPKATTLSEVQPLLVSRPFELTKSTAFTFGEQFGFSDSLAALKMVKEKGDITFTIELVGAASSKSVATLRTLSLDGESGISRSEELWKVEADDLKEGTVRLRISVESTIDGLTAVPEDYFADYELKSKIAGTPSAKNLKVEQPEEITTYDLSQNYPNPFNPSTVISYQLPENSMVQLEVFDLLGRSVARLVNTRQSTGRYSVNFDAAHLSSGVYIYRIQAGDFTASKKLFLIK